MVTQALNEVYHSKHHSSQSARSIGRLLLIVVRHNAAVPCVVALRADYILGSYFRGWLLLCSDIVAWGMKEAAVDILSRCELNFVRMWGMKDAAVDIFSRCELNFVRM